MKAKEYLQQLQRLDTMINQKIKELGDLRLMSQSVGGIDYSKERVQSSPSGDAPFVKPVLRMIELEQEINAEIDRFSDAKEQIIKQIRGLHNARYSQVLFKVYVQFKSLKVASSEMGMSYQYVRNLHKAALTKFEETYDDLHYLT